jgi:Proteasome stabiliser
VQLLSKLLCALINKLAAPDEAVRHKVMELLNLISTRIKPSPDVQLPALALIGLLQQAHDGIVQNMALVYLAHAVDRMTSEAKLDLVSLPCASRTFRRGTGRHAVCIHDNILDI